MSEELSYVILGRGRWAKRIDGILTGHRRRTAHIAATRPDVGEDDVSYSGRMASAMGATGAHVAWLCLPPGRHIPLITEAALDAGLHVIVEKPWLASAAQAASLVELAREAGRLIAVHYEYCFLSEIEIWRQQLQEGAGLRFSGRFTVDRPDHLNIPATENLGSHLLAIREYAVPHAQVDEIRCGHDLPDERRAWLERDGRVTDAVDFTRSTEPVIQRFIDRFEAGVRGAVFPLDLNFASRVAVALAALQAAQKRKEQS
jgi:Oxidoreductase family, NAD-binding Rossmann fold